VLEAPPTEIRRQIKALALNNRWADLLEAAENVMALPCGRAWLDLQRICGGSLRGPGQRLQCHRHRHPVGVARLLRDLPELLDATLTDETPTANPETQTWLRELLAEPPTLRRAPTCRACR
jgi:type VI secretion system protein ImpA